MNFYPTGKTMHIIIAGTWLIFLIVEFLLKTQIKKTPDSETKEIIIRQYLKFTNLFAITGSIGILITGIYLVINNSHYGFFVMSKNHWLASKQILFIIILINMLVNVLPAIKRITLLMENSEKKELIDKSLRKLFNANLLINVLVLLNFLFAITHKFYS